ncbi:MAG: tetratricopeptide repeat protein [Meiothermus sp.]|nr:tetratricopeptide repeat protein [Meiothermus sp.]
MRALDWARDAMQGIEKRLAGLALKRPGFAVGLWGEPGVGKTHAARKILGRVGFRSVCVAATSPLNRLVKALPLPTSLPSWLERGLERLSRGELAETQKLSDFLGALLAESGPLVLGLEDLHEASAERSELWNTLAQKVRRTPGVALLATSRVLPPEGFEAARVEPLGVEESEQLLKQELGDTLPEEANSWIFSRARGNPLFTLEYLRHLTRQGHLWNDGRRWNWREPPSHAMPLTVEALIEQTLKTATLEPLHREVLEARGLLTGPDPLLWSAMVGCGAAEFKQALSYLEQSGVLHGGDFAHPLYREVVSRGAPAARQQGYARRAVAALNDPVAKAEFLERASLDADVTREGLVQAAEVCEARGQSVEAARFRARAAQFAVGEIRTRLALSAAQVLRTVSLPEATRLAEMVLEDPRAPTEAVYLLAELLASRGRMEEVGGVLRRLSEAERNGAEWPRRLLGLRAHVRDFSGVLELWQTHPELRENPDPEVVCHVGWGLVIGGKLEDARALLQPLEAENLPPERAGDVHQLRGTVCAYRGEHTAAARLYESAVGAYRLAGAASKLVIALKNRANLLIRLGEHLTAKVDLEEALELCANLGDHTGHAQVQTTLGQVLLGLGEYEAAESRLQEALRTLHRTDLLHIAHHCENVLCQLYTAWSPPLGRVMALKHAESALALARRMNHPRFLAQGMALLGQSETRRGNPQRGLELCQQALEIAQSSAESELLCIVQSFCGEALEVLERPSEAREDFLQALRLAESTGLMYEAQRIGLRLDALEKNPLRAKTRLEWLSQRGLRSGVALAGELFPALEHQPSAVVEPELPRLEVLGPMGWRVGEEVQPVRGQKRKELLAMLLEARMAGRAEVGKLELLDALYPEVDEAQAGASLKTGISQLRSAYGQAVLRTTSGGYALGEVESDAEAFLRDGSPGLWRGPYLIDAESRDENVREGMYQALKRAVEERLQSDPAEAVRSSRILLEAEPYDLGVLTLGLRALRASNNHRSLARAYHAARERMLEVGESLPEQWAEFLEMASSSP